MSTFAVEPVRVDAVQPEILRGLVAAMQRGGPGRIPAVILRSGEQEALVVIPLRDLADLLLCGKHPETVSTFGE